MLRQGGKLTCEFVAKPERGRCTVVVPTIFAAKR
jgi:hypothetical protein